MSNDGRGGMFSSEKSGATKCAGARRGEGVAEAVFPLLFLSNIFLLVYYAFHMESKISSF
jgi:hypothetical protein